MLFGWLLILGSARHFGIATNRKFKFLPVSADQSDRYKLKSISHLQSQASDKLIPHRIAGRWGGRGGEEEEGGAINQHSRPLQLYRFAFAKCCSKLAGFTQRTPFWPFRKSECTCPAKRHGIRAASTTRILEYSGRRGTARI